MGRAAKSHVKIPQTIMQTWKNKDVPLKWQASLESISEHMPGWKHVLMTDEDNRKLVEEHFPDFLKYYDAFPHAIQRADAVRYCWLYLHGGLYMDLDMQLLKPLDPLFTQHDGLHLVGSGNLGSYITNSFMASPPKHPFWLEVIEEMKVPVPWWCMGKHWTVMNSTGPIMLNRVAKRSHHVYAALPASQIMPCSVCDSVCRAPQAYLKPLEGSSWIAFDTTVYNFFLCNWKTIVVITIIITILICVYLMARYMKWM